MIEIVKGHDVSSYFGIMPAKFNYEICNESTSDYWDLVDKFREKQISIEESNIEYFLYYFLEKHFDKNLEANIKRNEIRNRSGEFIDEVAFEWNLEDNFYSFEEIKKLIVDIKNITEIISKNYSDASLTELKKGFNWLSYLDLSPEIYSTMSRDEMYKYAEDHKNEIIDFYKEFISYMNDMIIDGEVNGYDLISFMGP